MLTRIGVLTAGRARTHVRCLIPPGAGGGGTGLSVIGIGPAPYSSTLGLDEADDATLEEFITRMLNTSALATVRGEPPPYVFDSDLLERLGPAFRRQVQSHISTLVRTATV